MILNPNNSLSKKSAFLAMISVICFVLFFVGGSDYYFPLSYKYFWNLGHILNDLKGALKNWILKVESMDSYCKEKFDRINRIIRIKGPSAKGRFAATDKKSNRSCKSCLPNGIFSSHSIGVLLKYIRSNPFNWLIVHGSTPGASSFMRTGSTGNFPYQAGGI